MPKGRGRGKTEHSGARDMSRKSAFWGDTQETKAWASRARRMAEQHEIDSERLDASAD